MEFIQSGIEWYKIKQNKWTKNIEKKNESC